MMKPECPDCGAYLQTVAWGWRCPWANSAATSEFVDGGGLYVRCGKPYKDAKRTEIAAPIRGKRLD